MKKFISLTIMSGLVIFLSGCTYQVTVNQDNIDNIANNDSTILYQDNEYEIEFTTSENCTNFYEIKKSLARGTEIKNYEVYVKNSQTWPEDAMWYSYSLYTEEAYDKISPEEYPGKPNIQMLVNSKVMLVKFSPQDGPSDLPDCEIKTSKIQQINTSATLPTTCIDEPESTSVITYISSDTGSIGDAIELRGCNFLGFEADKNAWIENEDGVKGLLYGERDMDSKTLKTTLKSPLCQGDNSYSGLPCEEEMVLTLGKYKIYTESWGQGSNKVEFVIE